MLRRPVYLSVEGGAGTGLVLHEPITDTIGCGMTVDAAILELTELLVDSYEQLTENESHLSPGLLRRLKVLQSVLMQRGGALAHATA